MDRDLLSDKLLLKEIIATSMSGLIVANNQRQIESYNPSIQHMLGYGPRELFGSDLTKIFEIINTEQKIGEAAPLPSNLIEKHLNDRHEAYAIKKDGTKILVQLAINIVKVDKKPVYVCYTNDLSEKQKFELLQRKQHEELTTLTSNTPGVMFRCAYHRDRPISFISPAIAALSGWEPEHFASGKVKYTDLMHADDEARIWAAIGTALKNGLPYTVEYRLYNRTGGSVWVSENGKVVVDDYGIPQWIVGMLADNTMIKTSNAEFESTVNALGRSTAVIEYDLNGCVTDANENFLQLMGYTLDEILGHHHRIFCTDEDTQSKAYADFWSHLRNGQVENGEFMRLAKDGREVWIQATYNPIFDADGKPYKVMKLASDLSHRRAMEQELHVAIERAESAVVARGTFLANMSHEIRTPMNAIIGFTELLLDSELNEEQRRYQEIILNSSRSLLRLLNEVLDKAKLDKGAVDLEIRDFSFYDLADQIISSLRVTSDKKEVVLEHKLDDSIPAFVKGDSLRVQQVLLNLLSNAVKFTEKGSVTLEANYDDGFLEIKVIDTGIGMDQGYLDTIFDPFTQSDASTSRRFGGTGLGTSISKQLVTLMEGTIVVDSQLGKGTIFTIRLPMPEGDSAEGVAKEAFKPQDTELPPLRVLAIDDTPPSLELLKITLERHGHRVTLAQDGQEGVEKFCNRRFDLVLTDLQMPIMDGVEAARQMRAHERSSGLSQVPIIALSANVLEGSRQEALEAGMNGFSFKPLEPEKLFAEIRRVLEDAKHKKRPQRKVLSGDEAAKKKNATKSLPSISGKTIDWESGLRLWGDKKVLARSIQRFLEDNGLSGELMQTLLADKQYDDLAREAHRLRGASGNLSLTRVHNFCEQIENACLDQEVDQISSLLDALTKAITAVQTEIDKEVQPTNNSEDIHALNDQQRADALDALTELLESFSSHQISTHAMDKLESILDDASLAPLHDAIDRFEFQGGQASAEALVEKLSGPGCNNQPSYDNKVSNL